jgi:hypothetical protein
MGSTPIISTKTNQKALEKESSSDYYINKS